LGFQIIIDGESNSPRHVQRSRSLRSPPHRQGMLLQHRHGHRIQRWVSRNLNPHVRSKVRKLA
jgi:hypothetical protein